MTDDNRQLATTNGHASLASVPAPSLPATGPRVGAPRNNTNAIAHGMHANAWPKGCRRLANRVNRFRRFLEAAVIEAEGEVGIVAASAIDVACKWQRHCELACRWLAAEYDKLEPAERLNFSREAARAATERDKAVRLLKLERSPESQIDALYAELRSGALDADPEAPDAAANAVGGHRANQEVRQ